MSLKSQPTISVGILSSNEIHVNTADTYLLQPDGGIVNGCIIFHISSDGKEIVYPGGVTSEKLTFIPKDENCSFEVKDVTIGVNFHWERKENQRFSGGFSIIVEEGKLTLINELPLENYLASVISSEMSATASLEFLKAHAVISRSWLLAQILKNRQIAESKKDYTAMTVTDDEIIRWYDREDHKNFDVCADDHCQRYQGITRQTTPTVSQVIKETAGIVLLDNDGQICDARFSKCCGGIFEEFENCWEPKHFHYLEARRDSDTPTDFPDLSIEENARQWIMTRPDAFCNTSDNDILGQVLNNYDQETKDFYRWTVEYDSDELSELIEKRSGIDFGRIISLEPLERGTSGRIVRLRITGTKKSMIIGKELEIRRTLSPSHLYSCLYC